MKIALKTVSKTILKTAAAFIAAVVLSSVLASIFSTQFVIAGLQSVGADVSLATRLSMTIKDFGILQTLGLAFAASLLVAFIVAGLIIRFIGGNRTFWYAFAGFSAITCLLILISWQLQLMPIAGARSNFGLLFQALAGGSGGWLFSKLTRRSEA